MQSRKIRYKFSLVWLWPLMLGIGNDIGSNRSTNIVNHGNNNNNKKPAASNTGHKCAQPFFIAPIRGTEKSVCVSV